MPISEHLTQAGSTQTSETQHRSYYGAAAKGVPVLSVHRDRRDQIVRGFGGALNESGGFLLQSLSVESGRDLLRVLFADHGGAALNVLGLSVGHTDYSLSTFSYNDTEGDTDMAYFSIDRDRRYLIPAIKAAQEANPDLLFVARADYPPLWMLDEQRNLKREYYDAFGRYIVRYCQSYEAEGIPVSYLTPFNEPLIYAQISAEEIAECIEQSLGPAMREAQVRAKLIPTDSYNKRQARREWPAIFSRPLLRTYASTAGYHSYHWEDNPGWIIGELHKEFPEIEIWQTEVMNLYTKPISTAADAEKWGKMIMSDLLNGTSAWLFWNLLIDPEGGPFNRDESNSGYPQDGVVVIDPETGTWEPTAKFYYFQHFSRFLTAGSVRLETSVWDDSSPFPANGLYWCRSIAVERPDGSIAVVVLNYGEEASRFCLRAGNLNCDVVLPAHSIATYVLQ
jgi:glucosylceramidase